LHRRARIVNRIRRARNTQTTRIHKNLALSTLFRSESRIPQGIVGAGAGGT